MEVALKLCMRYTTRMPFKNTHIRLSTQGKKTFRLEDELCYTGTDDGWTVPAGTETDFATVPRIIQWLIPTYGVYTLAAILHDHFCYELANAFKEGREPFITSVDTDGIFRRVMRELGVSFAQRWLMWCGVRWGAVFNKARRKGIARDLPMMILISILAASVVIPVTIFVGLGLAVTGIINLAFGFFWK